MAARCFSTRSARRREQANLKTALKLAQGRIYGPNGAAESDKRVAEQARGGTCHTTARGVPHNADDSLVHAVGSGAVREGDDGSRP